MHERESYLPNPITQFLDRSQLQEEICRLLIVSLSKVSKGACKVKLRLPLGSFLGFLCWPCTWNNGSCGC